MTSTLAASRQPTERSPWRAVALPSEHGGWGLTLEPVLLGLLVAWSIGGLALGLAAFTAFLVRTPLKLAAVDLHRRRWLDRSTLALRIAIIELLVIGGAVVLALWVNGASWLIPAAIAAPFVAVELSFDVRSRGRRLLPELCGAIGIAAATASIVLAGHHGARLAAAMWLVLAARAVGSIPFVRVQIVRLRRGHGSSRQSDRAQVASLVLSAAAVVADRRALAGAVGLLVLACMQWRWVRRPAIPAKQLGLRQMALGLALVAVTATGVLL